MQRRTNAQPKIRRYKKIYHKANFRPVKTVLFIVGLVAIFFLSWSLYRPIISFFSGDFSSVPEVSDSTDSELSHPGSNPEPVAPPEDLPDDTSIRAVYMPIDLLYDSDLLTDFVDTLTRNNINHVMLDIKNADGYLTYISELNALQNSSVIMNGAISNMQDTVALLHAHGFGVIAKIHVFRDPAGSRSDYDKAIHYLDSNLFWLDDSPENGGKTWLNPCSPRARDYVLSIAEEVASMGFDIILFDDVRFPGKLGSAYTDYGVEVTQENKDDYLKEFISQASQELSSYDTEIFISSPAADSLSADPFSYGIKPVLLASGGYAPTLYPADYDSALSPYDAVEEQLKQLAPYLSSDAGLPFLPLLQAFDGYTYDDIFQQVSALADAGFDSYILYSEDGQYDFPTVSYP